MKSVVEAIRMRRAKSKIMDDMDAYEFGSIELLEKEAREKYLMDLGYSKSQVTAFEKDLKKKTGS